MRDIGELIGIMKKPIDKVLEQAGLEFKRSPKNGVTWFNMRKCPLCDKAKATFECAVSETADYMHGVKCWHQEASYPDFLLRIGEITSVEHHQLLHYLANRNNRSCLYNYVPDGAKENNQEHHRRYQYRLKSNPKALTYLKGRGLTDATIHHFGLGLSTEYNDSKDALCYPIRLADGRFEKRYANYNIPGVSINPRSNNGWCKGEVSTYWSDRLNNQQVLIVCEGAKDLWRTWEALNGTDLGRQTMLITSTHGSAIPREWHVPDFWVHWDKVFLAYDNDEVGKKTSTNLGLLMGRDSRRIDLPRDYGKDLTDFWQSGRLVADFEILLDQARVSYSDPEKQLGYLDADPINNLAVAFNHKTNFLYYTKKALLRTEEAPDGNGEIGKINERYATIIVRSDRTKIGWYVASGDKVERDNRVYRLDDGTLLSRPPHESRGASWSVSSIMRFLDKKTHARPLSRLLRDVKEHLRGATWLPFEDDYAVLALAVMTSYSQEIFDAVPLILLNGPYGSGKSELGIALSKICCNAEIVGQSSPATIARAIDETRGTIILDDLEKVAKSKSGEDGFRELLQCLKVSYKKSTALKRWTDMSRGGKTFLLNFYGIKIISNTSGVDSILGSRMLKLQTQVIPSYAKEDFMTRRRWRDDDLKALRDEIHVWSMDHVKEVRRAYEAVCPGLTDRDEEIAAPLRVFAELSDDPDVGSLLQRCLARQKLDRKDISDPTEILREAAENLVQKGYVQVAISHIVNEMKRIIEESFGAFFGQEFTNQIPVWSQPDWVGRQLRLQRIIDSRDTSRMRVNGCNLRISPFSVQFIRQVQEDMQLHGLPIPSNREPGEFCKKCADCEYRTCGCTILGSMSKEIAS